MELTRDFVNLNFVTHHFAHIYDFSYHHNIFTLVHVHQEVGNFFLLVRWDSATYIGKAEFLTFNSEIITFTIHVTQWT